MKNGRYQIFTTTWHVMHFWDLFNAMKADADFYLVHNTHRNWDTETFKAARPIPENAHFVPFYEPGKYDFAILDVDQQCANPLLGKSKLPRELKACIQDIPRMFINHATPVYPEWLCKEGMTMPEAEVECRRLIKQIVGDDFMVVNSHDAASSKEWGWGHPIWHGMDPAEWMDLPKEPRVFTALSAGGIDEYYNRDSMNRCVELFKEKYGQTLWWAKVNIDTHTGLDVYKNFLGRSLIYLDTSFRTPMNRARTEAMLSGCCIVQVKGAHDLTQPVIDPEAEGKTLGDYMIQVDDKPDQIVELLNDLIENQYDRCVKLGQDAKRMAAATFTRERYRQEWLRVADHLITGQEL